MDFRLLLLVAVVIISMVPLAEANESRIAWLESQIAEHRERIAELETQRDGMNDSMIDYRISVLETQIENKQEIVDRLRGTSVVTTEDMILDLQSRLNQMVAQINSLILSVLEIQAQLAALTLLDPEPIVLPPDQEIDTVEPFVTVNGTEFGHNDTIRVIGTPGTLVNDGPIRLDGTEPELEQEYWGVSIRGDRSSLDCSFSYNAESGWRNYTDRFDTCTLDASGLINGTVSIPGHFHAGLYQASFYHEIRWSNDYDDESAESTQFILR